LTDDLGELLTNRDNTAFRLLFVKGQGRLGSQLVVDLSCLCTPEDLQNRIFDAVDGAIPLVGLDLYKAVGRRLTFKL